MEPTLPRSAVLVRRAGLVINAVIGLFALATGLLVTQLAWQGRLLTALFGILWLGALPFALHSTSAHPVAPHVRTGDWHGRPATVIDVVRRPMLAFLYICGGFGALCLVAMVLATGAGSSAWVVCAVLAAFLLSVAGEVLLALRRAPQVALTAEGLGVRLWTSEQWVAWDAITDVAASLPSGQPAIRVAGEVSCDSRRLLWRLGRRPDPGVIEIEVRAVTPHESALFDAINRYRTGAVHRDEPGTAAGLDALRAA